jgi:hypothetical protein
MSFEPAVGKWLARHASQLIRGLVISERASAFNRWRCIKTGSPQFLAVDRAAIARPWVAKQREGRWVYSWTIRSPEQRETAEIHADALICDPFLAMLSCRCSRSRAASARDRLDAAADPDRATTGGSPPPRRPISRPTARANMCSTMAGPTRGSAPAGNIIPSCRSRCRSRRCRAAPARATTATATARRARGGDDAERPVLGPHHLHRRRRGAAEFERARLADPRTGIQYHWFNRGYASFDDFLAALTSRKRKAIRKERAAAREGLEIVELRGAEIGPPLGRDVAFYQDTGARKWGQPYLTREFFDRLGERWATRCCSSPARRPADRRRAQLHRRTRSTAAIGARSRRCRSSISSSAIIARSNGRSSMASPRSRPARRASISWRAAMSRCCDLFNLEVATDPQISPDGRSIAYVRKSNDIMTDKARRPIWLVDVATAVSSGRCSPAPAPISRRAGRPTARASPMSRPKAAMPQLFVRWMASGESARITGLPDSPDSIAWSPDGRRIAYSMFVPDEGCSSARRRPSPKAPNGPIRSRSSTRSPTASTAPAISSPATTRSSGSRRRRRADPADLRRDQRRRRAVSWTPTAARSCSAPISPRIGSARSTSEIYRVGIDGGAPVALTSREGPDLARVSPDGRQIAYVGYRRPTAGYENALSVMNLDGSGKRVLTGRLDRSVGNPVWSADGRSIYVLVRTMAAIASRASGSTARSATSRPGSPAAGSTGPTAAAISASRATARSRSRPAIRLHPSDVGVATGGGAAADAPQRQPARREGSRQVASCRHLELRPAADRRLDGHSARLRSGQEISADPRDPRRPVRGLRADLLDRRPALCGGRLCRALHQPARLDLLRPGSSPTRSTRPIPATTMTI